MRDSSQCSLNYYVASIKQSNWQNPVPEWHLLRCRQAGEEGSGPHHIVTVSTYTRFDRQWNGNRPITRQSKQHNDRPTKSNLLRTLNAQQCIGHEFNAIEIFDQVAARDHADFASQVRTALPSFISPSSMDGCGVQRNRDAGEQRAACTLCIGQRRQILNNNSIHSLDFSYTIFLFNFFVNKELNKRWNELCNKECEAPRRARIRTGSSARVISHEIHFCRVSLAGWLLAHCAKTNCRRNYENGNEEKTKII